MKLKFPLKASRKSNDRRTAMFETLEARQLMTSVIVNTPVDTLFPAATGFVSLRNAIADANASTSATTITFSPTVFATPQTVVMDGFDLEFTNKSHPTTITGPTAGVTLSGNTSSGVFLVDTGVTVSITGLSVTKASSAYGAISNAGSLNLTAVTISNSYGDGASGATAGGLVNSGTAVLTNVSISTNTVYASATDTFDNNDFGAGGLTNTGSLKLLDSTLAGNKGSDAHGFSSGSESSGGLFNNGTATVINCTVATNSDADSSASFIYTGGPGGIYNGGSIVVSDSTIYGNSAPSGGGIDSAAAQTGFTISNSIVAGNSFTGTSGTGPDAKGGFTSLGYNLIGKTDGSAGFNGADISGTIAHPVNAKLGTLASNGGATETFLPLTGSPAIGAGLVAYVPKGVTTDQRGLPRIVNAKVDIGAVEVQAAVTTTLVITPPAAQVATIGVSKSFTLGSFTEIDATGPYTVNVVWGDGTANTVIKMTAAGTIPATAHTCAKTGTDTVSVTVTDSASHTSNKATFAVSISPVASNAVISGTVFNDANGDKKLDDGELGLGGYVVFIDLKGTRKFVTGDPTVTTAYDGTWSFTGLAAGTYKVLVEPVKTATATIPTELSITLKAGATSAGNLFGEKAIG